MTEKDWFSGEKNPVRELNDGWYSFLDPGFSLVEMRGLLGHDCESDLHFCRENTSWLQISSFSKSREPNRYLINMKPRYTDCKWSDQKTGDSFCRAPIELVISAATGIFLVQKKLVVLNHWGSPVTSQGKIEARCAVRITDRGCILLYGWPCCQPEKSLGVCVIKNPA